MMKYLTILLISFLVVINLSAQQKHFFIDFGPNDGTNGNSTVSPDVNGNHWNNITDASSNSVFSNLVDKQNNSSNIELKVIDDLATNGILNGGLLSPDPVLLGNYAIGTATEDYFFTNTLGIIAFDNLDPAKGYVFNLFASRNSSQVRWTKYVFTGDNQVVDSLQTSGPSLGGTGYNGNNSTILSTPPIRPDASGRITINITVLAGSFAYVGLMRVDEVDANPQYLVDFGPNDMTNGDSTTSPDVNGNYWNNLIDPTVQPAISLKNKSGTTSNAYIKVTNDFASNGILNGGLLTPQDSLLGEFAVATVTQDYFFTSSTGSLEIGQLDTTSKFVFSFFGTRSSTQTRVSEYEVIGQNTYTNMLQTSGAGIGSGGYNGNNNMILVTDTIYPDVNGKITINLGLSQGAFAYLGCMKMEEILAPLGPPCPQKDSLLIAVMGSSVALGVGGTNNQGYAADYTQLLNNRFASGDGADWDVTNISIGGNNTINVLNRWDTDLLPLCSRYVIYGLSLGNEGITSQGQAAFNQFETNLLALITQARDEGIEPVVMNCYTRNDFDATDYNFIKQMNLLIHSWDVASVNTLGAVDDGTGKWSPGYFADGGHPNDAGHLEFSYAIVPSLFDALKLGKPQPQKVTGTYLTLDKSAAQQQLEFTPDAVVHPFTFSFEVKTTGIGSIAGFTLDNAAGFGGLVIDQNGHLHYINSNSAGIIGNTIVNDNNWHNITLTHYYAQGKTLLYVDGILQGDVNENLETDKFILSEQDAPTADYRDWFFYRSAMNQEEITALVNGDMLKSSLELYAPLDGQGVLGTDVSVNLAQSINYVSLENSTDYITATRNLNYNIIPFKIFPNPSHGASTIQFDLEARSDVQLSIYTTQGQLVEVLTNATLSAGEHRFRWKVASTGVFICVLNVNGQQQTLKMEFIE